MLAAGDVERVEHLIVGYAIQVRVGQLGIQKLHVERRIMDHQGRALDEIQERPGDVSELRLVRQKGIGQAVNFKGLGRHVAFGIDVDMEDLAGRDVIDQFDTADLDDPMTVPWIETGGFRIEDDFAHCLTF